MGYADRGRKEQGYGDMYVPASHRSKDGVPAGGGGGGGCEDRSRFRVFVERSKGERGVRQEDLELGACGERSPVARSDA
jgi:hypothetical protein